MRSVSFFLVAFFDNHLVSRWMRQHEYIEQLNIQAHHSALTKHDEFVVDMLLSEEKVRFIFM